MSTVAKRDESENEEKPLKESIKKLFRIDPDDGSEHPVHVESMLNAAAVCMAVVSFLASAGGLSEFVFVGYPLRALLVSFALQIVLLVLSLNLPVYLRMGAEAKRKRRSRSGSRQEEDVALKVKDWLNIPSVMLALVFAASLFGSVLFDFTFLSNTAYSWNNEEKRYFQLHLENAYNDLLREAEAVAEEGVDAAKEKLLEKVRDVSSAVQTQSGSKSAVFDPKSFLSYEEDSNFALLADSAVALSESYVKDDAGKLIQDIQAYADKAEKDAGNLRNEAAQKEERAARLLEESSNWGISYSDRQKALEESFTAQNEADELSSRASTIEQRVTDGASLKTLVEGLSMDTSNEVGALLAELESDLVSASGREGADAGIEEKAKDISEQLIGSVGSSTVGKDGNLQLAVALKDAAYDYSAAVKSQKALRDARENSGVAPSDYGSDEWKGFWSNRLETASEALRQLPVEQYQNDRSNAEYNMQVETLLDEASGLRHDYLGDLNNLEQALVYLSFPYNKLAWITLFLALFLDLAPLGIGIFLCTRKGVVASANAISE